MVSSRTIRLILALGLGLAFVMLLGFGVMLTDSVLQLWERLQRVPLWLAVFVLSIGGGVSLLFGWIIFRLLFGGRKKTKPPARKAPPKPPTEEELLQKVAQAETEGVVVESVRTELAQLAERRAAGEIHLALFGEISSGKSSLVRALLPGAEAEVGVAGGTTRELHRYRWSSAAGDQLIVTDMPGLAEVGRGLDGMARDEALRAHLVIYLCDGDITRTQYVELEQLAELRKPVVLAINKADRYSHEQLERIRAQVEERVAGLGLAEVVTVSAGGSREVTRILPDGREEAVIRDIPPRVEALQRAVQRVIDQDPEALEQLRDSTVFVLAARRLDDALQAARREKALALVDEYAKKAVVGAMAAMAPGTDLLIQGYLGTRLIRELSDLYQIPVRQVDSDLLLELAQKQVLRSSTIILAIAGNGLKAFPGVGTLAGGVLHAIAYGILFDALGKALARSLEARGELHPVQTANQFKELIGEDLESSARRFAKLALTEARRIGRPAN